MNTAEYFAFAHKELVAHLGNPYVAYTDAGELLPSGFYGLTKDEGFSNYINRTIKTDYDVSFLNTNYYIAPSGEANAAKMRIWRIEPRIVQGTRIGTIIYTTSLKQQTQIVATADGLFALQ